jgi:membrane protein YdbS with pleckstrin-like domain
MSITEVSEKIYALCIIIALAVGIYVYYGGYDKTFIAVMLLIAFLSAVVTYIATKLRASKQLK